MFGLFLFQAQKSPVKPGFQLDAERRAARNRFLSARSP